MGNEYVYIVDTLALAEAGGPSFEAASNEIGLSVRCFETTPVFGCNWFCGL